MIRDLEVRIVRRFNYKGHPFSEIFYTFTRDGEPCYASTRLWHTIEDTLHARTAQAQNFLRRQGQ